MRPWLKGLGERGRSCRQSPAGASLQSAGIGDIAAVQSRAESRARGASPGGSGRYAFHRLRPWLKRLTAIGRFCRLDRYASASENFVLVRAASGSDLEAHLVEELVEVIGDTLVEPIELRTSLLL
jgi:hypothetical protein